MEDYNSQTEQWLIINLMDKKQKQLLSGKLWFSQSHLTSLLSLFIRSLRVWLHDHDAMGPTSLVSWLKFIFMPGNEWWEEYVLWAMNNLICVWYKDHSFLFSYFLQIQHVYYKILYSLYSIYAWLSNDALVERHHSILINLIVHNT